MMVSLTLEVLEIMTLAYEKAEEWEVIGHLLTNQLSISFISIQMVIGGQMFSKSMRGFRETYVPGLLEKEGVLAAVVIFLIPFLLPGLFDKLMPMFDQLRREQE